MKVEHSITKIFVLSEDFSSSLDGGISGKLPGEEAEIKKTTTEANSDGDDSDKNDDNDEE